MATVAVTGASGFVGRYVVRELLGRGHSVRALVRDVAGARRILGNDAGLTLMVGDVLDGRSPERVVDGCDACIHLIGIIREAPGGQTFRRMHVEATRAMLDACRDSGVRRFIHMSALGVSDEGRTEYQKTKFEAEVLVRRSGLDWTIFRPSLIHGAESEFIQTAKGWVAGTRAPYKFLPYFTRPITDHSVPMGPTRYVDPVVQPVAVEDVAAALVAALERPQAVGEVYNLAGPEALTWPEFLLLLRDELPEAREDLKPKGLPADIAAGLAGVAARVGLGGAMPFDKGMALMGAEDSTARTEKAAAHLGFEPRELRAAVCDYADRV